MCGISAILSSAASAEDLRRQVLDMSRLQRHRGPDAGGVVLMSGGGKTCALAHERLAIIDPEGTRGAQPLVDGDVMLTVNGEVFNHLALKAELGLPPGGSDCAVIIPLYRKYGVHDFVKHLDGMFAFVLFDAAAGALVAGRDHLGKVPLYYAAHDNAAGQCCCLFASEMKALLPHSNQVEEFPPGCLYQGGRLERWYAPAWVERLPAADAAVPDLKQLLTAAVRDRTMSDVPFGVLLSGGLDSSLVAALVVQYMKSMQESVQSLNLAPESPEPQRVHTFAIGLEGSPDLRHAAQVAAFLGTQHHELKFTVQEGLDALRDVIYHIETYDITTVRASTPMYLMARKIKALGVKMVLSGEGSDELFGGYLYFHKAPGPREFHEETVRKLQNLSKYDCLRANKSMAAWGVEARTPFLARAFVDAVMCMPAEAKLCGPLAGGRMEKHALRAAFEGLLPPGVLWRQKEQFSDGVGYSWIDGLKAHAEAVVTDEDMRAAPAAFAHNTPVTKEAYLYRVMFAEHFPGVNAAMTVPGGPSVACSTPAAIAWDASFQALAAATGGECSGRAVSVHVAATRAEASSVRL
jgi:asparagine synthase (glutamine-hydrolysing)